MKSLRVVNRTRDAVLGDRVLLADRFWSRLRGFLGRPAPGPGEGILLTPCDGVHMYGMGFPLDVVFLDAGGTVLEVAEALPPGSRTGRVRGARSVLEVGVGTLQRTGTAEGDRLEWSVAHPVSQPPLASPSARSAP